MPDGYHHGDLREAVLETAILTIAETGVSSLSLRGLAKRIGVAHTAPLHHFAGLQGLFTALAARGFDRLADMLVATRESTGSFLEVGVSYVEFARENSALFSVMFQPDLFDATDPALVQAHDRVFEELTRGVATLSDGQDRATAAIAVIAAWSMVHGIATLDLTGNLDAAGVRELIADQDILTVTRRAAAMLSGSHRDGGADGE